MRLLRGYGFFLITTLSLLVMSCSAEREVFLKRRANRLHEQAIVIDAHAHPKSNEAPYLILGEQTGAIEVDFITMKSGGLDGVFFSVPLLRGQAGLSPGPAQIIADIDTIRDEVEKYGTLAEMAYSPDDIRRIQGSGKRAILLSMETRDPFAGDLNLLKQYYDAGIRMITLPRHPITVPDPDGGDGLDQPMNDFGKHVIEEMNRLGMIIDITHTPDNLQLEIIGTSAHPVVASHSCARALNDIPREIPDSIIEALAEKGGVICVTFYPGHISSGWPDQSVTVTSLVNHIDHIVKIAGIDHVGFGSDFLGSDNHTTGLESSAGLPAITRELLKRGYSRKDIEKVLGGNLLRVFEIIQNSRMI